MFILVLLSRDSSFRGICKFSSYYDFLIDGRKDSYCYKLYEVAGDGNLYCIKEKI